MSEELNNLIKNVHGIIENRIKAAYNFGKKDGMSKWIPVKERLPECEQEVLISAVRKYRCKDETWTNNIITTALYEDGKMLEVNSKWRWEDIDYAGWNEEEDCGIIPEGWWEYRHYNPDEVYNNLVDDFIIAWMPLPEPYREDGDTE